MPSEDEHELELQDRLVSLRATFEDAINAMEYMASWQSDIPAESILAAQRRLGELVESRFGPVFNGTYIAPHLECSESELKLWFATNDHRVNLLQRVTTWLRLARDVGARKFLVDGSFITRKDNPGDVDCVVLLPDDFQVKVTQRMPSAIELLVALQTRQPKELLFAEKETDWWRWVEFFGRTREPSGRRKGLVEVTL